MRTTRRRLFGLLAAAAPAVAALGATPLAQADPRPTVPPGDVHLDSYWKGWDDAPKVQLKSDAPAGIYHPGPDLMAFVENGDEELRVAANVASTGTTVTGTITTNSGFVNIGAGVYTRTTGYALPSVVWIPRTEHETGIRGLVLEA